jgi:hypothetical protein
MVGAGKLIDTPCVEGHHHHWRRRHDKKGEQIKGKLICGLCGTEITVTPPKGGK